LLEARPPGPACSAGRHGLRLHRQQPFALHALAGELARPADRFRPFAGFLFGGFFVMAAELHLAENALALHFLLERLEGLIDVVVRNENLHAFPSLLFGLPGGYSTAEHHKLGRGCSRKARKSPREQRDGRQSHCNRKEGPPASPASLGSHATGFIISSTDKDSTCTPTPRRSKPSSCQSSRSPTMDNRPQTRRRRRGGSAVGHDPSNPGCRSRPGHARAR